MEQTEERAVPLTRGTLLLRDGGRNARAVPEGGLVRLGKADMVAAGQVETLRIAPETRALFGIGWFGSLRVLEYGGDADVLGFAESLRWMTADTEDDETFMKRIVTNQLAARPISPSLTALITPNMAPPHGLPEWRRYLDAVDDLADRCNARMDSGRQNVMTCLGYSSIKRLEYPLYMGLAVSRMPYAPEVLAAYRAEDRLTGEEQFRFALALERGHSYKDLYLSSGQQDFRHIRTRDGYMRYLRELTAPEDTEAFRSSLAHLADLGLLSPEGARAAVELLARAHLTEATAWLLDWGGRAGVLAQTAGADALDAEFSL